MSQLSNAEAMFSNRDRSRTPYIPPAGLLNSDAPRPSSVRMALSHLTARASITEPVANDDVANILTDDSDTHNIFTRPETSFYTDRYFLPTGSPQTSANQTLSPAVSTDHTSVVTFDTQSSHGLTLPAPVLPRATMEDPIRNSNESTSASVATPSSIVSVRRRASRPKTANGILQ